MHQKLVVRNGAKTTDATDELIDALNDRLVVDVSDLDSVSIHLVQVTDNGTVVLVLEHSFDGAFWVVLDASTAEGDFAAAAGDVEPFTLSDSNGMPLVTGQIRVTATTYTGTGVYRLKVAGKQRV